MLLNGLGDSGRTFMFLCDSLICLGSAVEKPPLGVPILRGSAILAAKVMMSSKMRPTVWVRLHSGEMRMV